MSSKTKRHILEKVWNLAFKKTKLANYDQLASHLGITTNREKDFQWQLHLPLKFSLETEKEAESVLFHLKEKSVESIVEEVSLKELGHNKSCLNFKITKDHFIQDVLDSNPTQLNFKPLTKKVIVEYSSPNIAKPFHVGHLRSTIIGNFISNLKKKLGKNVTKINYLGDWGTQFGLLKLGIDLLGYSEENLKNNPTNYLYEAYVTANKEAEMNPDMFSKAREIFQLLEDGDPEQISAWNKFREFTTDEMKETYERLGVVFDVYNWESSYGKNQVSSVLEELEGKGMLSIDGKGRTVGVVEGKQVPLVKSDGSTLYLLRDIAAVVDRRTNFNFDEMYYVVENGQSDHFNSLFMICKDLGVDKSWNMHHVKFGRVHGMSTRKGTVVFLKDILDEARDIMYQRQLSTATTKVEVTEKTADVLGTTAVIINDLKQRRQRDYEFSWDKALQTTGDSGIRLQYTHCRLSSLLTQSTASPAKECDPSALPEEEVALLVLEISKFEEVLLRANMELEACILVTYLLNLSHIINRVLGVLQVKGASPHVASQRLLLFSKARLVLGEGLRVLGITPLEKM